MMERRFKMAVPCKEFDIDQYKLLAPESHIPIYLEMYRPHMTPEDIQDLKDHKKFMRFMCYQDTPDSASYMYGYLADPSQMSVGTQDEVNRIFEVTDDLFLGEISYSTMALFFTFDADYKIVDIF